MPSQAGARAKKDQGGESRLAVHDRLDIGEQLLISESGKRLVTRLGNPATAEFLNRRRIEIRQPGRRARFRREVLTTFREDGTKAFLRHGHETVTRSRPVGAGLVFDGNADGPRWDFKDQYAPAGMHNLLEVDAEMKTFHEPIPGTFRLVEGQAADNLARAAVGYAQDYATTALVRQGHANLAEFFEIKTMLRFFELEVLALLGVHPLFHAFHGAGHAGSFARIESTIAANSSRIKSTIAKTLIPIFGNAFS